MDFINARRRFRILYYLKNEILVSSVILFLVLFSYSYYFTPAEENELFPPDPTKALPASGSKMQFFKKAAVSSDAGPCARIGRDILLKKGSAVDAAIAAMICNSVVNMQSAGVGGGFFMTIYKKNERKVYCLNARETAPIDATEKLYHETKASTQLGPLAAAVPGEIKGYWEAHQKFGKLPWHVLVQPTIDLCEVGYVMTKHQYASIFKTEFDTYDINLKDWFFDNNQTKKAGTKISPTLFCEFLQMLAIKGPEDFYTGNLSKMFIRDMKDIGAIIKEEDLNNYKADWQEPILTTLRNGDQFYSFPPPGSGAIVALLLNILEGYNFTRDSSFLPKTYHRIIEAMKFAFAYRGELGDPKFVDVDEIIKTLISNDLANNIRGKIKDRKSYFNPKHYGVKHFLEDDHGTSHICVLHENGDAVSVTSSINIYFGAGITAPRTAILLSSVMDDFSHKHVKNYFGLLESENNALQPGKRPVSSMAPSILLDKKGDVKVVIGAAGGPKIISGILLTLVRLLWFRDNLKEAIDGPRFHHQLMPMEIHYEYGLQAEIVKKLKSMGHIMKRRTESVVYALIVDRNDHVVGISDIRKDGGGVFGIDEVNASWDNMPHPYLLG